MTGYRLTEQFVARCMESRTPEAEELTVTFVQVALSMGLITRARIEAWERDARMLELVGQGIPRVIVAQRMSVSRKTLHQNLKAIIEARRAALKAAS